MITVTRSILIDCSLEEVFAFTSNYKNDIKWRRGVIEVLQFPDYITYVGTTTIETKRLFGQKYYVSAEVFEYKKNNRVSIRTTDGLFNLTGCRDVMREGNKTRFVYSLTANLNGFLKLLSGPFGYCYDKKLVKDLERLKFLLENN